MNKPTYKSYDELPLTLSALNVAAVLGISRAGASASWSTAKAGFPTLNIGSRIKVQVPGMDRRKLFQKGIAF